VREHLADVLILNTAIGVLLLFCRFFSWVFYWYLGCYFCKQL